MDFLKGVTFCIKRPLGFLLKKGFSETSALKEVGYFALCFALNVKFKSYRNKAAYTAQDAPSMCLREGVLDMGRQTDRWTDGQTDGWTDR